MISYSVVSYLYVWFSRLVVSVGDEKAVTASAVVYLRIEITILRLYRVMKNISLV